MHSVVFSLVNTDADAVFMELRKYGVSDYVIPYEYEEDEQKVIENVFRPFRGKVEKVEEGWQVTLTTQDVWQYNRDKLEWIQGFVSEQMEDIRNFSLMDIYRLSSSVRDEFGPWILDGDERLEVYDTYLTAHATYVTREGFDVVRFVIKEVYDFHD